MSKLDELLQRKRADVAARRGALVEVPEDDRTFRFDRDRFHIFAEVKRSSLSAGAIRELDPAKLARAYQAAGASMISVLTEEHYFGGCLRDLTEVKSAVSIPVLQKDFLIDPYQIFEAKKAGADFILLIARLLNARQLRELTQLAEDLKLNAIIEITEETDVQKLNHPVKYMGVNSRDLDTLKIDTGKFRRLRGLLPDDCFLIAESGINEAALLSEVIELKYNAALIGEHFLRAADPASELRAFNETARHRTGRKPQIKICGITNAHDAQLAMRAGADALGFIFAESPRKIRSEIFAEFRSKIPSNTLAVGVFKDQSRNEIVECVKKYALDVAQVYDSMDLPFATWNAKTIGSSGLEGGRFSPPEILEDLSFGQQVLWDVKVERERLPAIWHELSRKNIFALAGGLDPENVSDAIAVCHPQWVDVARGVEREPGIKDEKKLQGFITAARRVVSA
jgi:indole-3-glycerol phosphate synthase/phosphoribosylanthranilate isomerase